MADLNPNLKSADTLSLESQSQLQSQSINNQGMGLEDDFCVIGTDGTINPMADQPRADSTPRQRTQQKLDGKNRAIREQTLAIDTTTELQRQFRAKTKEYIHALAKVNEKLVQIQNFEIRTDSPLSITERAIVKEKPSILLRQAAIKKDIKTAQKQVDDAAKQLLKEKADLDAMTSDYDQCYSFAKDIGFESDLSAYDKTPDLDLRSLQIDKDISDPLSGTSPPNPTFLTTSADPPPKIRTTFQDPLLLSHDNSTSIDTQFSDGMLMPAFQSKAVNQRSLKKMLQDLEGRLHWPITIEMDRELCALSEIQAALVTDHPQLESYALLVKAIRNQLSANRVMLDRITICQLEMRLIPMASRVAIKITLSSFSHNSGLKKELYKPAHFETRAKLFMCLPGEVKPDPSSNWKNPNKTISIKAAQAKGSGGRGARSPNFGSNQRGRGRGKGRLTRQSNRPPNYAQFSNRPRSAIRGGMGGQRNIESGKQRASRLKLCFTCNRPGHQNKDCPSRRQQPPANLPNQ